MRKQCLYYEVWKHFQQYMNLKTSFALCEEPCKIINYRSRIPSAVSHHNKKDLALALITDRVPTPILRLADHFRRALARR